MLYLQRSRALWRMAFALARLGGAALRQFIYVQWFFKQPVLKIELPSDGSVTPSHLRRMRYYGVYFVANIGQGLATLRGQPLSIIERRALTWFSIFIPLFDDWFDKPEDAPHGSIATAIQYPESQFIRNHLDQLVFKVILPSLHQFLPEKGSFDIQIRAAITTQIESKTQQHQQPLSPGFLKDIMDRKGGAAVLLARVLLKEKPSIQEEALFFHIGALIQYMDDIFDIREDYLAGIQTLATRSNNIATLRTDFNTAWQALHPLLTNSGFEMRQQKKWHATFRLWAAMTWVALDQLEAAQISRKGAFSPANHTRAELVTDMALWKNRWAWVRAYVK